MAIGRIEFERVRELQSLSDDLDRWADALADRLREAREGLGQATRQFAMWTVIDDSIATLPTGPPFARTDELIEASKQRLAELQEAFIALTVDAEIGPELLSRVNAARDVVRSELAVRIVRLSAAQRKVLNHA